MTIGERIRKFRVKRGLLQKQLAQKSRMSESAIRNYELDNRTPKKRALEAIAASLDVSPYAIANPTLENEHGVMHTLFRCEEMYGLKIHKIDDQVCLIPKAPPSSFISLGSRFHDWHKTYEKYCNGEITEDDYQEWKASYPEIEVANTRRMIDQLSEQMKYKK